MKKATVIDLLKQIPSGIGLDVAKNHAGVFYWDGGKIHEYGLAVSEAYDKSDPFAEYRMRLNFKKQLKEIVGGKFFSRCVIENVYGGTNFDTVRKLLALNTVIDELIFEGSCGVDKFYRWEEPKWLKYTRQLYKQRGKFNTKVEVKMILNNLGYNYEGDYSEDIMDAAGMLLGVIAYEMMEENQATVSVKMSDVKMYYMQIPEDVYLIRDSKVEDGCISVPLDTRNIEKSVLSAVAQHPTDALVAYLPSEKLGSFGLKHKFQFYEEGDGYLVFYKKK